MRRGASAVALLVVASVVLSGLAVGLPPGPPPGLPGDDLPDAPAADAGTFSVKQGDTCVPVQPFQGNQRVDEFYDYRTPYTNESSYRYATFMPDRFTRENASSLFLYEGPDGVVSLVVVHDEQAAREVRPLPRSAVTFRFDGLPDSGEWVLVDDTYDDRDDRFDRNRIDWRWGGSRADGQRRRRSLHARQTDGAGQIVGRRLRQRVQPHADRTRHERTGGRPVRRLWLSARRRARR